MPQFNFNEHCEKVLARAKRQNAQKLTGRLDSLCEALRQEGNHVVQTKFGGSVQKGTYVTGLSDVDVLLIVNDSSLVNEPPAKVKEYVRKTIRKRMPNNPVQVGKLAVTVKYADGMEIQLLPAIRTRSEGIRIARPGARKWSKIAHPDGFADKLAKVNTAKGGRVVPVIKLAKAIADSFITRKDSKISGYHLESLAIDAFQGYQGKLGSKVMLDHLFKYATKAVLKPIVDSTGQSRYVDEYLGSANSQARQRASTHFGQMRGKVNSCDSTRDFNALFGIAN
ncbi:MAG: nucleotidyltransferase [Dehalococcoidia bacterium]|nr:nucleotidyltransferase [Dehalococcoidia bacterium]